MRTKKAIINYITETVPEILIMFLGFFRIKFFLKYLGTDILEQTFENEDVIPLSESDYFRV